MNQDSEATPTGRSALLLGATGLVGGETLDLLLASERYDRVRVLTRRRLQRKHPKLEQQVLDFDSLPEFAELFGVDDVFCCLGTTMTRAGSAEAFRKVDFSYVVEAAHLASEAGAEQFLIVTAVGADPDSRIFYNRIKGEVETAVKRFPFRALWILRPALLLGEREDFRMAEWVTTVVTRPISFLLVGRLRRYRPVHAREVATALLRLAAADGTGGVVESERILEIAAAPEEQPLFGRGE